MERKLPGMDDCVVTRRKRGIGIGRNIREDSASSKRLSLLALNADLCVRGGSGQGREQIVIRFVL